MDDLEHDLHSVYETARALTADVGKLGADGVRYGVAIGELALQASARTLDEAARALGKVADRLRHG